MSLDVQKYIIWSEILVYYVILMQVVKGEDHLSGVEPDFCLWKPLVLLQVES